MIVDERLVTYINSLDTGNTAMLDQIEREATADYVPIIRKEMQSFLKFLLAMKKPARILEVGTAVGFSAILWRSTILCRVRLQRSRIKSGFRLPGRTLREPGRKRRLRCWRAMPRRC